MTAYDPFHISASLPQKKAIEYRNLNKLKAGIKHTYITGPSEKF
jgi:hypothetical protein